MAGEIKGSRVIHMGGKSIMNLAMAQREAKGDSSVKLPFRATGWKSSKMPAGITKEDIKKGFAKETQIQPKAAYKPEKNLVQKLKAKLKPKEADE